MLIIHSNECQAKPFSWTTNLWQYLWILCVMKCNQIVAMFFLFLIHPHLNVSMTIMIEYYININLIDWKSIFHRTIVNLANKKKHTFKFSNSNAETTDRILKISWNIQILQSLTATHIVKFLPTSLLQMYKKNVLD